MGSAPALADAPPSRLSWESMPSGRASKARVAGFAAAACVAARGYSNTPFAAGREARAVAAPRQHCALILSRHLPSMSAYTRGRYQIFAADFGRVMSGTNA